MGGKGRTVTRGTRVCAVLELCYGGMGCLERFAKRIEAVSLEAFRVAVCITVLLLPIPSDSCAERMVCRTKIQALFKAVCVKSAFRCLIWAEICSKNCLRAVDEEVEPFR